MANVKKIIERLLVFFIGLPIIVGIVLFLPFFENIVLNLVIVIFSGLGAVEFSSMLVKKNIHVSKIESFILGALAPLAITMHISFGCPALLAKALVMAGALWPLLSGIFCRSDKEIEAMTNKVIGCFALLIYPGFFMSWIIQMNAWGNNFAILLFMLIVFASDSVAWLFGTLFGNNNRGIIAISPNKSIAGFIGAIVGPILIALGAAAFFAPVFFPSYDNTALLPLAALLGFFAGLAAILGDLSESAAKRSCDFKDSGNLMPGRGGILDSIDSIAVCAPVFYILYTILFL